MTTPRDAIRRRLTDGKKIRVGLVGANPDRGWAVTTHFPALQALPDYEVVAVATTKQETADRAAQLLGASAAYGHAPDLCRNPDVDLVVVSVKVPHHYELVAEALRNKKHVYCEWPLGNGIEETRELCDLAQDAGVHHAIGLQARSAPAINYIRDLVAEGYVGEVLSSSVVASGMGWGAAIDPGNAYLFEEKNGATMMTVIAGHLLDAVCYCLGELQEISALTARRRQDVAVVQSDDLMRFRRFEARLRSEGNDGIVPIEIRQRTTDDQLALHGLLESDAVLTTHIRGGLSRGTNLLWEINGTEGEILITGASGTIQMLDLQVRGARGSDKSLSDLIVPAHYIKVPENAPSGPAFNVAQTYAALAHDMRHGTSTCPNFELAVKRYDMLALLQKAAKSQRRERAGL